MHDSWESPLIWVQLWPIHWLGWTNWLWDRATKVVFMGSPLFFKIWSPESLSTNSETSNLTLTRSHNRHLLHSVIYLHVASFWFMSSSSFCPWVLKITLGQAWVPAGHTTTHSPGSRCVLSGLSQQRLQALLVWGGAYEFAVLKSFPGNIGTQLGVEPLVNANHPVGIPDSPGWLRAAL